ncbi:MAG: Do family serine endopeptidase [Hyphomonadaceae bacterium]|nr:Do family serine endopeptidase [Hyphomonadaceae bacterium]
MLQQPFGQNFKLVLKRGAIAAGAAAALFTGSFAAQTLATRPADAQQIQPQAVAPPGGAPGSFADLIDRVSPAVVSIQVRQRPNAAAGSIEGLPPGFEDFFRRRPGVVPREPPTSLGSGFLINADGTIVTNHHVVANAEEITVRLSDGREIQADVVGTDEPTDIAVLRLKGGGRFPYVSLDRGHDVRVGDWVVAVGNPFGLDGTATAGIVSAKGRRDVGSAYVDFLQIDAPINRGNSGGPTFDLRGRVIGVNSAIFSPTGGNVGIGFAIPSETAARIIDQLVERGRVTRGWLGVQVQPLDSDIARSLGLPDAKGAMVASVVPDGPAARAGLQQGDVVLTFNGEAVEDSRDLTQKVGSTAVGRPARVDLFRGGQRRTINVRLAERPAEQQLAASDTPEEQSQGTPPAVAQASLGVSVRPLTPADRTRLSIQEREGGVLVTAVTPNSDLARKGVRPGDVILMAGERTVRTAEELGAAADQARRTNRPLLLQVGGRAGRRYIAADVSQG